MYADYLKERYTPDAFLPLTLEEIADEFEDRALQAGMQIFKCPEGFITFEISGDAVIWYDIYVRPEFRGKKIARKLNDALENLGRANGKRVMIGFSEDAGKNQHLGVTAMKAGGFIPAYKLENTRVFIKGI